MSLNPGRYQPAVVNVFSARNIMIPVWRKAHLMLPPSVCAPSDKFKNNNNHNRIGSVTMRCFGCLVVRIGLETRLLGDTLLKLAKNLWNVV